MTYGVFGLPAAGKTTFLTKCAVRCWEGRSPFGAMPPCEKVFSNFPLKCAYKLDFELLGKVQIENALLLIDEISLFADSRNFKNFDDDLKMFFALHRHYNCNIIFCSQYWSDCDKRIRNITDSFFLIERAPLLGGSFSVVKPISRFMGVENAQIQDSYELGGFFSWRWVRRKKYYKYFDSYDRPELKAYKPELW